MSPQAILPERPRQAISSTLILVRIGLGVDVKSSEGKGHASMDSTTQSLPPDLEQAMINVENSNPATIHPFSLKYNDLPPGSATFMPGERGNTTVRPFSLKYRVPSLPEPGRIIGRLIRPSRLNTAYLLTYGARHPQILRVYIHSLIITLEIESRIYLGIRPSTKFRLRHTRHVHRSQ
ncbi:hypothetical protein BDP27DRAFT_1369323 [Rhodocollybia butyracea]|uniref:Uncharacterized protein n=1 Tax=Rhodocollybia butyracea TaxID=206335 RepID=A0A9P5PET5_9AGAR|nr:hypothetical protein BDP27DRAFT_1369323 [Rhodocollybia butyracea]